MPNEMQKLKAGYLISLPEKLLYLATVRGEQMEKLENRIGQSPVGACKPAGWKNALDF